MKSLLVTGGAGFIGSNFVKYMLERYAEYKIVNLDLLTYAGNLGNLKEIGAHERHIFVKGDIRDRILVDRLFDKYKFDYVINFAAESHVDRSIENPEVFLTTNVIGTQVLLDVAKANWKLNSGDKYCKEYKKGAKFVQISTDEVYGDLGEEGYFIETTPLMPNSPYSVSKASADMLVRAYGETYALPYNITRCSNNYGPYQFPEKLIPLMIINCISDKDLPVYGDGMQIRDWLHVHDHCSAIDLVLHKGEMGEVYNIGGNNEKSNIEIVNKIIDYTGKSKGLIKYVKDRLGHDSRYAIDNNKITKVLGWSPIYKFEDGIEETMQWYLKNTKWLEEVLYSNRLF